MLPSARPPGARAPGLSALKVVAIVVVVIVVLGVVALLGLLWFASNFKPPPPAMEQTRTVYNGTFDLNAGQAGPTAWTASFTVGPAEVAHAQNVSGLYNPTLSVSFLATGGTVQVYVMDGAQFYNYQHGAQFTVLYMSGQVYSDKRTVMLPATSETYYTVAENTALFGNVSVSANFGLRY